jgi:nucleoside-diphosphate kinase
VPPEGIAGSKNERSFIAVKPDGVQRGLIGDIIKRFEQKGFKLVGLKLLHATQQQAEGHYEEHRGKPFFPPLVSFFASGPIVAMVWEGEDVIASGRKLMGATKPKDSAPGTIRGDYGVNMGRNIIHGSDGVESAKREINYWFRENEVVSWTPTLASWLYE